MQKKKTHTKKGGVEYDPQKKQNTVNGNKFLSKK